MDKSSHKFLSQLPAPESPPGLEDRIIARVRLASLRGLYARLAFSIAGCTAGIVYLAIESGHILMAIQQSAAFNILPLAYTDPDIVFGNLQDMLLGLGESIPFGAIALGAGLLFSTICAVEFAVALFHAKHRPATLITV